MKKICSCCGREKRLEDDFYKDVSSNTGYRSYCKECSKSKCKKSYQKNRNKTDNKHNEWIANHKEKWQDYYKKYKKRIKIDKLI